MADKKEQKAKTVAKSFTKKASVKKEVVPKKPVEQQFFAADLAEKMGIRSYDFFLIKRAENITDTTPITMSKMKELYNKIIEGR